MKNFNIYLTILLISPFIICEENFKSEKNILVLNDENFIKAIQTYNYLFVLFHIPFNPQCKKILFELEKASKEVSNENIFISKIDLSIEKNISNKYNIEQYPTLLFFNKGEKKEYTGGGKSTEIVHWILNKIGKNIIKLNTFEEIEKFKKENDIILIYYGNDINDIKEFTKSSKHNEEYTFVIVESEKLIEKYSQKGKVILYKNYENKIFEITNIKEQIINDLIQAHAISHFMEFDEKAAQIILGKSHPALILYSNKKSVSWKEYVKLMKYISTKIKGRLLCIIANIKEKISAKFAEYLGVKEYNLPSLLIVESKGYLKKYKMDNDITEKNIMNFIYDWENKNLKQYYKSEKEPRNNNGNIIEIIGNTFYDKVIDNGKDIVVLFYTNNCLHCKVLFPKYEKLAKKIKERNNEIIFTKINMAENEIENEDILSFPCIKLYPGNKKNRNNAIIYEGDRSIDDLINFIKKNAFHKIIFEDKINEEKDNNINKISDL